MEIRVESLEEAFFLLLEAFERSPGVYEVSPRGQNSKDLVGCQLFIENPRNRLIFDPVRAINLAAVIGETLWHLRGSDSVDEIAYYIPQMRRFSDDGCKINSSYGICESYVPVLIDQLRTDPDSKRAVISFVDSADVSSIGTTKDFPCTLTLHFLIRAGRLEATAFMRAQDVFWGLQHDIFFFTFLQEMVSLRLGIPLGSYRHVAGVFNLYKRHYEKARRILRNKIANEAMPMLSSLDEVEKLKMQEPRIRNGDLRFLEELKDPLLEDFRRILLHKRTGERKHLKKLQASCFRRLIR
ncbi:hypothetical protein JXA56_05945 [Candidatus Micrarchaeota archaeon]|nr:hypothetical protein [Candidatus Micrarchaeota archaeon]